ncbi:MAG: MATE family efflux transporter [Eggerthellaceae bacterium]|nr:MATE family efflux transporter [Eggerthellaceae bacterium]
MGTEPIPKLITEFAIPAIIGMLVNAAYNIISSVFLGQVMHETGQAVVTAANPIAIIFIALAMLVGNGGNALAALRLGNGDRVAAERSLGNTVTLAIIFAAIVAVLALTPQTIEGLLSISGATPEVHDYAKIYIQILACGFLLQCIGFGVNNFIRTAGNPNRALFTMVIGAGSCIIFNFFFVLVFGWGVVGSALATVAGQGVSCISVLWFFTRTKNVPLKLHLRYMPLQGETVRLILSLGFASFAIQAAMAIVNFVLNNMLVTLGAQSPIGEQGALASIGVVSRIAMFTVMPLLGTAVAIQPLLGYNYGAHLFKRVRTTWFEGMAGATVIAVFMWTVVHVFPEQIVGAFGLEDSNIAEFTIFALKVQLLLLPLVGFQIVGTNYFQATGQPLKSAFLALTRQLIFLVPLYLFLPGIFPQIFPQYTGLDALYFAVPISDFLAIFTTLIFVLWELRRIKKLESGEIQARF